MEDGRLGILDEIQVLVSDKLQVVSYKWLSRNFSLSSNVAKRVLQEFVHERGSGLEVIYSLCGWLKTNPDVYHVKLVSGLKLAEVKQKFEDACSVQVYSVQACIPKDPAAIWNAEFVQTEELFNEPPNVDNCLRDNRFCAVSNAFVKRSVDGKTAIVNSPQPHSNNLGVTPKTNGLLQVSSVQKHPEELQQQPSTKVLASTDKLSEVKRAKSAADDQAQPSKSNIDKQKDPTNIANKKKNRNEKGSSSGGSLANLWTRASEKAKSSCPAETVNSALGNGVTAEAQICAREGLDGLSSDDEGQNIKYKRDPTAEGNRKRRVVFDFSDDEDDDYMNVVSLASPDPPKTKSALDSCENLLSEREDFDLKEHQDEKSDIKQEKMLSSASVVPVQKNVAESAKVKATGTLSKSCPSHDSKGLNNEGETHTIKEASTSPKRRKVLKTRVDERGREVNEVVWEGDAKEGCNDDKNTDSNDAIKDAPNDRPAAANKAPATAAPSNTGSKTGNKKTGKGGPKDAKQGNILSFFKKI